eukprot:CAMPEP_0197669452 /NCGR_PEP_ID=MMETSP1338-20131121/72018_1 /TAXON_ID=43686 ORGANISM="Pelagodinium beii, Strain RCC1491" /NCGR_SAMPLE_ID=MMETSP1338 /ASSEMBLY_ACC=CAM_ASM_000754 /LENGTH=102 /DNA_ID=CAMNT_0043249017 /DNA_START=674 /DNA_END=982 /DNA_ORIENTATION=-
MSAHSATALLDMELAIPSFSASANTCCRRPETMICSGKVASSRKSPKEMACAMDPQPTKPIFTCSRGLLEAWTGGCSLKKGITLGSRAGFGKSPPAISGFTV